MLTLEHEKELLRHLAFMVSYLAKITKLLESIDGTMTAEYQGAMQQ